MERKVASGIMLTLLLIGMLTLAFNIQSIKAEGDTIYIRADGSIDPPTANITTTDKVTYYFTDNNYDEIMVERNNIIIDGASYTLQGNGSGHGIDLSHRSNVIIKNAIIKGFNCGIYLDQSSNNSIIGNNITTNNYGVWLFRSFNNILRVNSIANNMDNFGVLGWSLSDYLNDIDSSNTVDGKPIYYWIDKDNMSVPLNAGYVGLISCTRIRVENLNLTKNTEGILLVYTTNSTISKNYITNNGWGIVLAGSSNNSIFENTITGNKYSGIDLHWSSNHNSIVQNNIVSNDDGIWLGYSATNNLSGNTIANNGLAGVWLECADDNNISGNSITNNWEGIGLLGSSNNIVSRNNIMANTYGIGIYASSNNSIYHNNFINNPSQFRVFESMNVWDNGYPSGGNYWSDYNGIDSYSGLYQNLTGNDGIGDTQYTIDANNRDRYPYMIEIKGPYIPGDLNHDGKVDITDIAVAAKAFGSYPGHRRWNPLADINHDNKIDMRDLARIAKNFGKTWS